MVLQKFQLVVELAKATAIVLAIQNKVPHAVIVGKLLKKSEQAEVQAMCFVRNIRIIFRDVR